MSTLTITIDELDPAQNGYPMTIAGPRSKVSGLLPADLDGPPGLNGDDPIEALSAVVLESKAEEEKLGHHLFKLLVPPTADKLWDRLARRQGGFRIVLDIAAPELRRVPWELVYHSRVRVATVAERAISRKVEGTAAPGDPPLAWPLKILVVIGADDLGAAAEQEIDELEEAFRKICGLIDLEILWLPSATEMGTKLDKLAPHVLHVIAHGDDEQDGTLLLSSRKDDEVWEWSVGDIPAQLPWPRPRLVVLNACHSAGGGASARHQTTVRSFAESFLEHQVPAVIAMQGDISGPGAAAFSRGLYSALAEGAEADVALARARWAIAKDTQADERDWILPSLVSAVPPEQILTTCPELDTAVRTEVEDRIRHFIDRADQRREVWSKLALGCDREESEADALVVKGGTRVGKSDLVRWCLGASELQGRNVAHVDLKDRGTVPYLTVLGDIANVLANNPMHRDRNEPAFKRWIKWVDNFLGAEAMPKKRVHAYHRVLPNSPAPNANEKIITQFRQALTDAAGNEPLVVAFDHVDPQYLDHNEWEGILVQYLLADVAAHKLRPIRVILVMHERDADRWTGRGLARAPSVVVKPWPGAQLKELVRTYLLHHDIERPVIERLFKDEVSDDDWGPDDFPAFLTVASRFKARTQ